ASGRPGRSVLFRREAAEEEPLEQLPATPHADLLEDMGEVPLHRRLGDVERAGDLACGAGAQHEVGYLPLPLAQSVGGYVDSGELPRFARSGHHYRLDLPVSSLPNRSLQRDPPPRT